MRGFGSAVIGAAPGSLVTEAPSKLLRYVPGFKQPSHADVTGRVAEEPRRVLRPGLAADARTRRRRTLDGFFGRVRLSGGPTPRGAGLTR
jgi:hypothetical protein